MTVDAAAPATTGRSRIWAYTLVAAVVPPVIAWIIADPLAGHALHADTGGGLMRVTVPWVIAGALISGAVGLALATVLRRLKHGRVVWLIVSNLALLLSLGSPLEGTNTVTVLTLMAMHVLVGAAVIPGGLKLATR